MSATSSNQMAAVADDIENCKVSLKETGLFSPLLIDYLNQTPGLESFYSEYPSLENFEKLILKRKDFPDGNRAVLADVLTRQYAGISNPPDFNILRNSDTFVVTTGHQLNIFSGPLYIIYKIITTINLTRRLREVHPHLNFVPVYWMATEDHDFEEIASFQLFGKKYTWEGVYSGAVGRLDPSGLKELMEQLPEKFPLFEKAYTGHSTLADAVRYYMHELFGQFGLISLDPDDRELKKEFVSYMQEEILEQKAQHLVTETSRKMENAGYHTQLHARELNLFYLKDNLRERIEVVGEEYRVVNSDIRFSQKEILDELAGYPERFSPNVVLRPVYQEVILPNLAYVGGPSELPYWMQLKGVFDAMGVPYPALVPRNFALYINSASRRRMEKLGVEPAELFENESTLRSKFVSRISEQSLDLNSEKEEIEKVFSEILKKSMAIDKSMEGPVGAERAKLFNGLDNLEKRLKKAEERNHETEISQLVNLKNKFFPNGTPQERTDNLLSIYLNKPDFLHQLLDCFDPLDFRFNILIENQDAKA